MLKAAKTMHPLNSPEAPDPTLQHSAQFVTTHWSAVLAAAGGDSHAALPARAQLYQVYRYPLYAYARRCGRSPEEAEDLIQGFFESAIKKNVFAQADQVRGRFRDFLRACLKHYLADERDYERAAKRGGGRPMVSFDLLTAEEHYCGQPHDDLTPDRLYDLQWAHTLAQQARARLREEYVRAGKAALYDLLNQLEPGARERLSHAEVAQRVGKTEVAVKNEASRLHRRFGELLRAEVRRTVANAEEVQAELRYLLELLQS